MTRHSPRHVVLAGPRAILLLAVTALPATAGVNSWNPVGPSGGNGAALIATAAQPSILLAGTYGAGLFRSANGGMTWVPIGLDPYITALAADPQSASTIYASDGSGVAKSLDSGLTWKQLSGPLGASAIVVDPHSSARVYAASSTGLFRSGNGGVTWLPLGPSGPCLAIAADPAQAGTLYALRGTGLFRTTDGGATWSEEDHGLPLDQVTRFVDYPPAQLLVDSTVTPSTVYLAYLDRGAVAHTWSSNDGGGSWQRAGPGGFPLALGAGVIYASGFASADHGRSWQAVSTPPEAPTALAAVPSSATAVFASTPGQGIWKSGDGAASWQPASTGINATSPQALAIDPLHPGVMYTTVADAPLARPNDTRLLKTEDGGGSWYGVGPEWLFYFLPAPLRRGVLAIDPVNPSILYSAASYGAARSGDGGVTWKIVGSVGGDSCFSVDGIAIAPLAEETVYAAGQFGHGCNCGLVKTTDSGNSWSCVNSNLVEAAGIWVAPSAPQTVFVSAVFTYGNRGRIAAGLFRSSDGGATWTQCSSPVRKQGVGTLAIDPTNPDHLIVTSGPGVFSSFDAGVTWKETDQRLPRGIFTSFLVTGLAFDPLQPTTIYAAGGFGVYRTSDSGDSWHPLYGLPSHGTGFYANPRPLAASPSESGKVFAGTFNNGIYAFTAP
jgi:photosystem II stability/assembly factor-like uncharacterized protein